jgi:hypothetical protein
MRRFRVIFKVRWIMVIVAGVAIGIWADRMRQRRVVYLRAAAPHALNEAFYARLAQDLAGVPQPPPPRMGAAFLPDGSAVEFVTSGPSPQVYYPFGSRNFADEATLARLIALCDRAAAREGKLRRVFEYHASRPWLTYYPGQLKP